MKNITPIILSSLFLLPAISIVQACALSNHRSHSNPAIQIAQTIDSELQQLDEAQDKDKVKAKVNGIAKDITVRITSANNGGSGVLIAKKGNTYLVLTNAHVTRRTSQFEIQAPDGQKYTAKPIDGGFDPKYDLALLQFTSQTKYTLAYLSDIAAPLAPGRIIYSAGFPFDSKDIRITSGEVSQLSDIPFNDGTQIGYTTNKGERGIRQGMSGGSILDARGNFLGINTIGAAPILPNYTYNDGSKPIPKLAAQYRQANWGIPVYNFLTNVKPDILYGYDNLPKVQRQVTPTGYMAKLSQEVRQKTVRIESKEGHASGVIVAKEVTPQGTTTYYALTAKYVVQDFRAKRLHPNLNIITHDQEIYTIQPSNITLTDERDLAIVKFTSTTNYLFSQLGDYSQNNRSTVFIGGFPGRERINSPVWQWQLNPGKIYDNDLGKFKTKNQLSFTDGYNLIYSNIAYGGMGGGGIFDTQGRLIGIHGRGETTEESSLIGNSLGISIQNFIVLSERLKVNPKLLTISKNIPNDLNQTDLSTVTAIQENVLLPPDDGSADRWIDYGNQLYRIGKYSEAIVAFDRVINKNNDLLVSANYGKALALRSNKDYTNALLV